jgi:hypothetical protein
MDAEVFRGWSVRHAWHRVPKANRQDRLKRKSVVNNQTTTLKRKRETEDFKNRVAKNADVQLVMAGVQYLAAIASMAVIVFGNIAEASNAVQLLVATTGIGLALSSFVFLNGAIDGYKALAADLSSAEAATASGKLLQKQPWMFFRLFGITLTILFIVTSLRAIYS